MKGRTNVNCVAFLKWWDWCVSEDEKMEIDSMFIKEL